MTAHIWRRVLPNPQWLLALYPATWRERYGEEFAALLEDSSLTLSALADVLLGALDAHISPQDTNGRILRMINQPRRTAIAVFAAYIVYVIAGIGFQKLSEYDDFADAARAVPLVGSGYTIVYIGAIGSLLAVLVGGLPLAFAALRYGWTNRRWDIPLLLSVPAFAFAALFGFVVLEGQVLLPLTHTRSIHDPLGGFHVGLLVIVFLVLALASTTAVSLAIARSAIDQRLLRFTYAPAVITTIAMALTVIGLVMWGMGLRTAVPGLWNGNDGLAATSTSLSWAQLVAWMILATLIAVTALVRGRPRQHPAVAQPA